MLKTGNCKLGSLKLVSEFPPPTGNHRFGVIGVDDPSLEIDLTTSSMSYPASSSSGHKNTQMKGFEFVSSFRRHLRCCSRLKIFRVRLIYICFICPVSLKSFDLRPGSSHSIKPLSSLASNPFKGLTLWHDDPLPVT